MRGCSSLYDYRPYKPPKESGYTQILEKLLARKEKTIEALKKAVILKENNRYIQACFAEQKTKECEKLNQIIDKIKTFVKSKMFYVDCENWFERFEYCFENWQKDILSELQAEKQKVMELEQWQEDAENRRRGQIKC